MLKKMSYNARQTELFWNLTAHENSTVTLDKVNYVWDNFGLILTLN